MTQQTDDVLVIGGGVIGVACAYYLSRAGSKVAVIDQADIGAACSHANCGYVCPSHVLPLTEPGAVMTGIRSILNPRASFRIKPQARLNLYRWLWQFARRCNRATMLRSAHHLQTILDYSAAEFRALLEAETFDCEWQENGLLYVFETDAGMREFAATDALLREHFALTARRIDGAELQDFDAALKPGLAGAWHYVEDASLRPDKLMRDWAHAASDQGAEFYTHCKLTDVAVQGGRITGIETSAGFKRAEHYVFATGAWSGAIGKMLRCELPVEPGKGYSVTMSRPKIAPQHPMLFPEHRVGATPFAQSLRLGSMMEFSGYDDSIPRYRIDQLKAAAVPYLQEPVGDVIEETWFGWRPMTWDSLPIIGFAPGLANAVIATGHNMLGLSLAAATGRLVQDLTMGEPCEISVAAFSPQRFR